MTYISNRTGASESMDLYVKPEEAIQLQKKYKMIANIYGYFQAQFEENKQQEPYKKALEIVKEKGLSTALYDDCLANWAEVDNDIDKILFDINIEKKVDIETSSKLRYLAACLAWPLLATQTLNSIIRYSYQTENKDFLPIRLEWSFHKEYSQIKQNRCWLEENFFTTSSGLVRAIVYGDNDAYEYNFQSLPFKKLLGKIQELSTKWGETARRTGFDFDKIATDFSNDEDSDEGAGKYLDYLSECEQTAWDAAPEALRNEHIEAIRQLVQEVWKYHLQNVQSQEYSTLPSTPVTKGIKQILNNPTRISTSKNGEMTTKSHYLTGDIIINYKNCNNDLLFTLEKAKELFTQRAQKGPKVFNFLIKKLNEQNYRENTVFLLSEIVEAGIYADKRSAFRGLEKIFVKMYSISLEGKSSCYKAGKKQITDTAKSRVISSYRTTFNDCHVSFAPIIREAVPSLTILPDWANKLNENSYMLLDYIFYIARQNTIKIKQTGKFNISLNAIRAHMAFPTPEEVKNSMYDKLIKTPIMDAIEEIENARPNTDLKITPYYNIDGNIHDFLAGYLEIELDEQAQLFMTQRALAKEKEEKQKQKRIEKAKQKQIEKQIEKQTKAAN